jgi:hypothetical protein
MDETKFINFEGYKVIQIIFQYQSLDYGLQFLHLYYGFWRTQFLGIA